VFKLSEKHELLVELLREVNRGVGKYVKNVLAEHDISVPAVIICKQLKGEAGITISELARRTGMAKSHISNIIRELEQKGWVRKKTDSSDHRVLRLYLHEAASAHLELLRIDIRQNINALVADITEQKAEDLIQGLREIIEALDKVRTEENGCEGKRRQ
jgi:DNA-binding MarR family transcriptional regulator